MEIRMQREISMFELRFEGRTIEQKNIRSVALSQIEVEEQGNTHEARYFVVLTEI
jgi:hypothetical protein